MTYTTSEGLTINVFRGPWLDWGISIHHGKTLLLWHPEALPYDEWGFDTHDPMGVQFFELRPWSYERWRERLHFRAPWIVARFLKDVRLFDRIKPESEA